MLMIQIKNSGGRGREEMLNRNIVRALGFALQEVKNEFMTTCSAFTTCKLMHVECKIQAVEVRYLEAMVERIRVQQFE